MITYLISVDKKCAVDFHTVLSLTQDCIHTDLTIELAQYLRTIDSCQWRIISLVERTGVRVFTFLDG